MMITECMRNHWTNGSPIHVEVESEDMVEDDEVESDEVGENTQVGIIPHQYGADLGDDALDILISMMEEDETIPNLKRKSSAYLVKSSKKSKTE